MPKSSITTIKAYMEDRYEVRLVQFESGGYRVLSQTITTEPVQTDLMFDYHLASIVFDAKCIELGMN